MKVLLVMVLILTMAAGQQGAPTELQRQISALQQEIAETRVLVEQLKADKATRKEISRQESRAAKLAERRNRQAGRIRDETAEVREANRKLNARLRAQLLADKLAKEQIETPQIRIAREVRLRALLQVPQPTPEQKMMIAVMMERDAALAKIARANRRWHCKFLRIGCIGHK